MENIDSYRHKGLRKSLVKTIRAKGIRDKRILDAIGKIPRHLFLDSAFADIAYQDKAFPILAQQTISQPYTVAFQTELLDLQKDEKVLEIGTGSGYQACVLAELKVRVYTIERHEVLFKKTSKFLFELGYPEIRTYLSDGMAGLERHAPYDKILVTAGAIDIPNALIDQLKIGGCLVIPVGSGDNQEMYRITKKSKIRLEREKFGAFRFVPLLPGTQ